MMNEEWFGDANNDLCNPKCVMLKTLMISKSFKINIKK